MRFPYSQYLFVFILTTACSLFSQPKDVSGWNKALWGMNENEVLAAFERGARRLSKVDSLDGLFFTMGIDSLMILGNHYRIRFAFDPKDQGLCTVHMVGTKRNDLGERVFMDLENSLTEKYGAATNKTTSHESIAGGTTRERKSIWLFPSTIIELYHIELTPPVTIKHLMPLVRNVGLYYRKRSSTDEL